MRYVAFFAAAALCIVAAGGFLSRRDSCSNPDFASYGGSTTCETHS